jgi:Holliday junction resolvasome RuvABC ATP-dependent DNA helicase subunit
MRLYTKDEVAKIVKLNHPEWDENLCGLIAHYCSRVPREALEFAEAVRKSRAYKPASWEAVARRVADLKGIDEYGMSRQRLEILKALGQRPMSINGLCVTAGVKEKELRKYVLPWLLESTPDQKARVVVTSRHYISPEGLAELEKRGIEHRGSDVLAPMDR